MEVVTGSDQAVPRLVAVGGDAVGLDPACLLPAAIGVDDADTPADIVDALALAPFAAGQQPYASVERLSEVRPGSSLLPPGATVLRRAAEPDREACLAAGDGWMIRVVRWRGGGAEVSVTAVAQDLASTVLNPARDAAVRRRADEQAVSMGFWHRSPRRGPHRVSRRLSAAPWAEIRSHYTSAASAALDELMAVTPDTLHGQLVLLHGAPGTGKTTALRTLAREWRTWCQADCVLDPEILFSDPGYLMDVVIGHDTGESAARWRLLLLEDCDDLIREDAERPASQPLSRLLNLTDGMLGQGRQVLVAMTSNQDLRRLHPAVTRPGRCLAHVEIGPLSPAEAGPLLGHPVDRPVTLAELHAMRTGHASPASTRSPETGTGLYL
jgi:hypothetical protein